MIDGRPGALAGEYIAACVEAEGSRFCDEKALLAFRFWAAGATINEAAAQADCSRYAVVNGINDVRRFYLFHVCSRWSRGRIPLFVKTRELAALSRHPDWRLR